jgi:carbamoyl-phosphate synthase small subunit
MSKPAILALEDGSLFHGIAAGAEGQTVGEVVFNTSMTGYQEILTDPSYAKQIVTLTYPHIGNVGINAEDAESTKIWVAGLVIRDLPTVVSNWRAEQSLDSYLRQNNIVAIAEVDTRKLTRVLQQKGALNGCIMAGKVDEQAALQMARSFPGLTNMDLAKEVSTTKAYSWTQGSWQPGQGHQEHDPKNLPYHVVVYDYGVKLNILRLLVDNGCRLTVVPAQTPIDKVLPLKPDGVVFSNGPGDPAACDYAIETVRKFIDTGIPILGICLGHQLLGLACGAKTVKMKFGHHGANHPVQDLATKQVVITSQNHGFAIDDHSLPPSVIPTHRSLFDGSLQGISLSEKPVFGFQGHPEASPGPHDVGQLFQGFIASMESIVGKSERKK